MWLAVFISIFFAFGNAAEAAENKGEPIFLSAEELGYDRKLAKVVALGKVQVIQG